MDGLRGVVRSAAGAGRFARMAGSSVAAPDAAGWVTDLLNAAYYAREPAERDVDDLRLASAVVTTRWARLGHRLHAGDVLEFHRAYGWARLKRFPRGTLTRAELLRGAERIHGDWFPEAWADPARRGWGIVFPTQAERAAYAPESRLRHAALGLLTPPRAPIAERTWHTYAPVPVPDPDGLEALLHAPERWPDAASALGRFTPLRRGGLPGQSFEIDVVADPAPRTPIFTRGYVTATAVLDRSDPGALDRWVAALQAGGEALPPGGRPRAGVELTTHAGHFLGRARSQLLLWDEPGGSFLRDVGVWDPLPWPQATAYRAAGKAAQAAFWGEGRPEESFLHQLALLAAGT